MGSVYSAQKPPSSPAPMPPSGRRRGSTILSGRMEGSLTQAKPAAKPNPVIEGMINNILRREGKFDPDDPSMRGVKLETLQTFRSRAGNPLPADRQKAIAELRKLTEG